MDDITVSVAILAYKHEPFLRQCLDSVLEQNVDFKYEIVVGEDCSCDGSKEILLEYKEKYPEIFTLILNEKNLGAARNSFNVRKLCRGKYVAGLEADDYWCDNCKLKKQVDFLEKHPEYSAVGSNSYSVDYNGNNRKVRMSEYETDRAYSMKDYFRFGMIVHTNTLLYRNVFPVDGERYEKVRFCVPTMGDVFRRCMLYDAGDIYCLPEPMLCHRLTPEVNTSFQSAQKNKAIDYTKMMIELLNNITWYFDGKYDFSPILCNRMANILFNHVIGNIKLDMSEYKKILKTLSFKNKISVFIKFLLRFYYKAKQKIYRNFIYKGALYEK